MTEAMFLIDQEHNDRLLLEAEQRKRDQIDYAVRRFAPHLAEYPDIRLINLYSTNASLRKEIRSICGGKTILVEHCGAGVRVPKGVIHEVRHDGILPLPKKADMVVTKATPTRAVEWLAARLGCYVTVLPEAADYFMARLEKQQILTVVGSDQAR